MYAVPIHSFVLIKLNRGHFVVINSLVLLALIKLWEQILNYFGNYLVNL